MRLFRTAVVVLSIMIVLPRIVWAFPFPQLLPNAENFELTVHEDSGSSLPLGKSCGGEAALTLACRAFVVTLKNIGEHTVHLSRIACQEPEVTFEMKEPRSSTGWWPISQFQQPRCTPWHYLNTRLRPGESIEYRTRLVSPARPADPWAPVKPGSYMVRARWQLWGCIEKPEGSDCLAPLQIIKAQCCGLQSFAPVDLQDPIEVISKEIEVGSPALPDLGPLRLGFDIALTPDAKAAAVRKQSGSGCATDPGTDMECTVFHFAIHNLSSRAVRNGRYSCSDFSMIPEYRTSQDSEWKKLPSKMWACTANIYFETPILPGEAAEGDFTLSSTAHLLDTSPLYPAGKYEIRFRFQSSACWASPDGSFCVQRPKEQVSEFSNAVMIDATAYVANGKRLGKVQRHPHALRLAHVRKDTLPTP